MRERVLTLLAAVVLAVAVLRPALPEATGAVAAAPTTASRLWQHQAQGTMDDAPDADCQNGGQCSN